VLFFYFVLDTSQNFFLFLSFSIFLINSCDYTYYVFSALYINLGIGEVVQTLDVKTMAEQWKAYTAICEKYAAYLMEVNIYQECVKLLCSMILNNMKTSMEVLT
jgi:hypothetical protein